VREKEREKKRERERKEERERGRAQQRPASAGGAVEHRARAESGRAGWLGSAACTCTHTITGMHTHIHLDTYVAICVGYTGACTCGLVGGESAPNEARGGRTAAGLRHDSNRLGVRLCPYYEGYYEGVRVFCDQGCTHTYTGI
jgi:hypothetical protein